MNVPQTLLDRAKKEREKEVEALKARIETLCKSNPIVEGVCIYRDDPLWENALRVCLYTAPHFGGSNYQHDSISFFPYPSKYEGCWRINAFSWECHVPEEHVFKRWNNKPCDCYECKRIGK